MFSMLQSCARDGVMAGSRCNNDDCINVLLADDTSPVHGALCAGSEGGRSPSTVHAPGGNSHEGCSMELSEGVCTVLRPAAGSNHTDSRHIARRDGSYNYFPAARIGQCL